MPMVVRSQNGWSIVSDDGQVIYDGLTNAQAWRKLDFVQSEPLCASHVFKEMKELRPEPSQDEKQQFLSGLVQIGIDRGYSSGWAWHKFHEKFGHTPEGLTRDPAKPSKQVWGWVHRKSIAKARGPVRLTRRLQ